MSKNDKILFVWDFHGVLEKNNEYAVQEVCNLTLKKFNIDKKISLQEVIDWYGLSFFDYFKLAVPEGNEELWKDMVNKTYELKQRGWNIIEKHIRPQDYSNKVLKEIKNKGHYNIVLSNSRLEHTKRFVKVVGLNDYLNEIIGAENTHHDSRASNNIHNIKAELLNNFLKGSNYKKIIAIGDKESDIVAGKKCGATTYLFINSKINKNTNNTKADYTISDLREVLKELE